MIIFPVSAMLVCYSTADIANITPCTGTGTASSKQLKRNFQKNIDYEITVLVDGHNYRYQIIRNVGGQFVSSISVKPVFVLCKLCSCHERNRVAKTC